MAPENPAELSRAILRVTDDEELRGKMGRNARKRAVDNWDKTSVLNKFEQKICRFAG